MRDRTRRAFFAAAGAALLLALAAPPAHAQTTRAQQVLIDDDASAPATQNTITLRAPTDATLTNNYTLILPSTTGLATGAFPYVSAYAAPNATLSWLAVGSAGQMLGISGGLPAWQTPSTYLNGSFVLYDVSAAQNISATRTNNLFNVAYAAGASDANAAGAVITSAGGATNRGATGLTITATATGTGVSTGLNVSASGGASNYAAILSGTVLVGGSGNQLQLQGTSTGLSTFQAGAQGATTINYTLPLTQPNANNVLTATAVAGTGPYNVTLAWQNTITNSVTTVGPYGTDQNNLNVVTTYTVYRISASASISITGILATGISDGRQVTFVNVGTNTIRFTYDDALSTAANRIYTNSTGAAEMLGPNDAVTFWYDGTSTHWRLLSKNY